MRFTGAAGELSSAFIVDPHGIERLKDAPCVGCDHRPGGGEAPDLCHAAARVRP
jgi:hypothetical protein